MLSCGEATKLGPNTDVTSVAEKAKLSLLEAQEAVKEAFNGTYYDSKNDEDYDVSEDECSDSSLTELAGHAAVALVLQEPLSGSCAETVSSILHGAVGIDIALLTDPQSTTVHHLMPVSKDSEAISEPCCTIESHECAAAKAVTTGCHLTWQSERDGTEPPFQDWKRLLQRANGHLIVKTLITVPLQSDPGCRAIGAAHFAFSERFDSETESQVLSTLNKFALLLSRAVMHNTKHLWEVSLDLLLQILPPTMLHRMLSPAPSNASHLPSFPPSSSTLAVSQNLPEDATDIACTKQCCSTRGGLPTTAAAAPQKQIDDNSCKLDSVDASYPLTSAMDMGYHSILPPNNSTSFSLGQRDESVSFHSTADSEALATALLSPSPGSLNKACVFGFPDVVVERRFSTWFCSSLCQLDKQSAGAHALIFAVLIIAALMRGIPSMVAALALQTGPCCVILPTLMVLFGAKTYQQYRIALVIAVRLLGTGLLLLHWLTWPQFYAGAISKGIVGRAVGRIALGSVHSRLPFLARTAATVGELYLCAIADAFMFCGHKESPDGSMGLVGTLLVQLGAAAITSTAAFWFEKRARAAFLSGRGQDAMVSANE